MVATMAYLSDRDRRTLNEMFKVLDKRVQLVLFAEPNGQWSDHVRGLIKEVVAVRPDRLSLDQVDLSQDRRLPALYGVERGPTLVFLREEGDDTGIRTVGVPSGYEFGVLVEDIVDISTERSGLGRTSLSFIRNLDRDLALDVFVVPT